MDLKDWLPTVISGLFSIIAIIVTNWIASSKSQKKMKEEFKLFEAKVDGIKDVKTYGASRKMDIELSHFGDFFDICEEIKGIMYDLIPIYSAEFQNTYPQKEGKTNDQYEKEKMDMLSHIVLKLKKKVVYSRWVINEDIFTAFKDVLESTECFFRDYSKYHDAWDEGKEDHERKHQLKDTAYATMQDYDKKCETAMKIVKEYINKQSI